MSDADNRGQSRLKEFKNVNKGKEEWRQRRNTSSSELRQNKRENQFAKRRHALLDEDTTEDNVARLEELPKYAEQINSDDVAVIHEGVMKIRKLMCVKENPPIKAVLKTNAHWRLINILNNFEQPNTQFEAAWALTNIVSGDEDDTKEIVGADAIPPIVRLLQSPVAKVRGQSAWALGNIAGEAVSYRDEVLRHQAMELLLKPLWDAMGALDNQQRSQNPNVNKDEFEILQTGTWTISNFVRGKTNNQHYNIIKQAIPFLARIVSFSDDHSTLADACWALSYLTDSDQDRIQVVVEAGVTMRLVELMGYHDHPKVVSPALRTIGNILTGSDVQTTVVLSSGALDALDHLLDYSNSLIRKESAWAMSNVFAGTPEQISQALEEVEKDGNRVPRYNILSKLLSLMMKDEYKARKEAAWAVSNLITIGKAPHMHTTIYDFDGLSAIVAYFKSDILQIEQFRANSKGKWADNLELLARNLLQALLVRVLPGGQDPKYHNFGYNIYVQRLVELEFVTVLEQLCLHKSNVEPKGKALSVPEYAEKILDQFFKSETDQIAEYSNQNEGVNQSGQYEFNPNATATGGQFEL